MADRNEAARALFVVFAEAPSLSVDDHCAVPDPIHLLVPIECCRRRKTALGSIFIGNRLKLNRGDDFIKSFCCQLILCYADENTKLFRANKNCSYFFEAYCSSSNTLLAYGSLKYYFFD
ncbi:hypothetical protein GUJ93_ZPchr0002g25809 [Zizania palustris]|uniref:Uncharacterized protein n=1 Tax=Zizania palustris TaxID=103762 RepID=A0A8J5S8B1_ZIZPA|nr:hypothetical protein GUJ93_ZPchr0002g25809 [Zizania palustris]